MLRGTSRRVVVVRSPDPKVFEEAIFIVREDFLRSPEKGRAELMQEARRAADGYLTATLGKRPKLSLRLPGAAYAVCAAIGGAVTWLCLHFFAMV